jgi:hypothetical protein
MTDEQIKARWQQLAIEIGEQIRRTLNTSDMIGGDHETGYLLMFFNLRHHDGRATIVSNALGKEDVKKLLEYTLSQMEKAIVIEPTREN